MPGNSQAPSRTQVLLEQARFLADASATLASSLDYRATLSAVAHLAVPLLADTCIVDLVDVDGEVRRLVVAAPDAKIADPARPAPGESDHDRAVAEAVRTREAFVGGDSERSIMVVPLVARDAVLGAITLVSAPAGRRDRDATLLVTRDLAGRAVMAIDNAHLIERAQQAIRAREEVLSFVSHDLRSPLMGILLTVETVLRAAPSPERRKGWNQLDRVRRGALQMRRMIDDMLDVASLDAGQMLVDAGAHDVGRLFDDAFVALAPQAAEKALALRFEPPAAGLAVRCDRDRVVQVLSNLVGNSIRFTPPGGSITVSARAGAGHVAFAVSDTGSVISPPLRPRTFERFWPAEESARKGQGLDLYIAKGLVEAQGGTISVDSTDAGGTTFSFTLPIVAPQERDGARPAAAGTAAKPGPDLPL